MKKLVLLLIALIIILPGCGTSTVASIPSPSPSPSLAPNTQLSPSPVASPIPSPKPSQEPLNTAWVSTEMQTAKNKIQYILAKSPTYYDKGLPETPVVIRCDMFGVKGGTYYWPIQIDGFNGALLHINNAFTLAEKGKLPEEANIRIVKPEELTSEVIQSVAFLGKQKSEIISVETKVVEAIKNSTDLTPEYQSQCIKNAISYCDDLATQVDQINSRLKIVMETLKNYSSFTN